MSASVLPMFSSRSFIVSGLTFKSLIHFDFIFVYGVKKCSHEVVKSLSHVQLFVTPWTVAHQAPPFMEFSRQEYWSGLPFPSPGNLSEPGDRTPVSRVAGRRFTVCATRESQCS